MAALRSFWKHWDVAVFEAAMHADQPAGDLCVAHGIVEQDITVAAAKTGGQKGCERLGTTLKYICA